MFMTAVHKIENLPIKNGIVSKHTYTHPSKKKKKIKLILVTPLIEKFYYFGRRGRGVFCRCCYRSSTMDEGGGENE